MLNRESLLRGDAALTARQRQTVVFIGGIVVVVGALVLSFSGLISALIHRDDPVAMQAVSSEGTATTTAAEADATADAGLDRVAPDLGGAESGAAGPTGDATAPATGGGKFTGTYKPSKSAGSPSPLAPTATTAAPGGEPGPTTPTTLTPGATTASTAAEPTSTATTGVPSSSTTTTRPPATTTTTTRVTVTEATVPPTVITTPSTRPPSTTPPTSAPPTSAPPSSPTVSPGPVS